jgi:hypothetical protein
VELNKINIKMYAYSWVFGKVKQTLVWSNTNGPSPKFQGCILDAKNNIRINFWHTRRIVCLLHKLAEGIWQCKLDYTIADRKGKWNRPVRKIFIRKLYMD